MSLNDKLYNNVELKESISALIDNELITDNELELLLSDSHSFDCYVSYSKIHNSLKSTESSHNWNLTNRIVSSIEELEDSYEIKDQPSIKESKICAPHWLKRLSGKLSHVAVAASVSLCVVVGFQSYNSRTDDSDLSEAVQFNPAGSTQPVSYQPKANFTITPNQNYSMELKQLDSHQMSILQDYNEKKFDAVSSH